MSKTSSYSNFDEINITFFDFPSYSMFDFKDIGLESWTRKRERRKVWVNVLIKDLMTRDDVCDALAAVICLKAPRLLSITARQIFKEPAPGPGGSSGDFNFSQYVGSFDK